MKSRMLSQSLEDYLKVILVICKSGKVVRVKDIAESLDVKMPSVTKAILELKKIGLVSQKPYFGVELTDVGEIIASDVFERHELLKKFLMHMGISESTADKDACSMEHNLSAETFIKINEYVQSGFKRFAKNYSEKPKTKKKKK